MQGEEMVFPEAPGPNMFAVPPAPALALAFQPM